jgi:hypothetical protein
MRALNRDSAIAAHFAIVFSRHVERKKIHAAHIEREQSPDHCIARAGEHFDRLRRLHRANDTDERREHAHRRAALFLGQVAIGKQTRVARRIVAPCVVHAQLSIELNGSAGNERFAMSNACAIDLVPRGETIAAIDHHIRRSNGVKQRLSGQANRQSFNANLWVDCVHALRRRIDFLRTNGGHVVCDLALQISEINHIIIGNGDCANARAREIKRHRRAEAARADDERARGKQTRLPVDADFVEQDVARIAKQLLVIHNCIL